VVLLSARDAERMIEVKELGVRKKRNERVTNSLELDVSQAKGGLASDF